MSDNTQAIRAQIADLENTMRLIANTMNLIADMDIKGGLARGVFEIQMWLENFYKAVQGQTSTLKGLLPAETPSVEAKSPEKAPAPILEVQ